MGGSWFVAAYIRSIDDIVWSLFSEFCDVPLLNWIHLDFWEFWLIIFDSSELWIRGIFPEIILSLKMLSRVFSTKITWWYLRIKWPWNRIFPIENHISDELNLIDCELSSQALSSLFLRCIIESSCSLFSKTKTFWQNHTKWNDIEMSFIFKMNEKCRIHTWLLDRCNIPDKPQPNCCAKAYFEWKVHSPKWVFRN